MYQQCILTIKSSLAIIVTSATTTTATTASVSSVLSRSTLVVGHCDIFLLFVTLISAGRCEKIKRVTRRIKPTTMTTIARVEVAGVFKMTWNIRCCRASRSDAAASLSAPTPYCQDSTSTRGKLVCTCRLCWPFGQRALQSLKQVSHLHLRHLIFGTHILVAHRTDSSTRSAGELLDDLALFQA